ncbi:hypothetical protein NPIL_48191, partial [Nephila pilipes]
DDEEMEVEGASNGDK